MGIGTLIIFIATILVAAVAAGVLISTSGVLQQRALITGQEARKKITNAIEVVSIVAYGNKTDETLNNFEVMLRLDAGSDPTQMKKFDVAFIGPDQNAGGKLSHPSLNDPSLDDSGFYENITSYAEITNRSEGYIIRDLDEDGYDETLYFKTYNDSSNSDLIVEFSDTDLGNATYDLGYDLGNFTGTIRIRNDYDNPIVAADGKYYGYLHLNLTITENSTLNISSANNSIGMSRHYVDECTFDTVPIEDAYCYEVIHGDDDVVLGDGEVFLIKYKLLDSNRMSIAQNFQFIFTNEKGRMTRAQARTPDIIQTNRVPLWPLG